MGLQSPVSAQVNIEEAPFNSGKAFNYKEKVNRMQTLKKQKTIVTEEVAGFRYAIGSDHHGVFVEVEWLDVDLNGSIIQLEHDTSQFRGGGGCTYCPDDDRFEDHVRYFMSSLLEQSPSDFKDMRSRLNSKWRDVAEAVRKSFIDKYNF